MSAARRTTDGDRRPAFARVVAGEWTKLAGQRSTPSLLALGAVLTVGVSALVCWLLARDWADTDPGARAQLDPVTQSLQGVDYGLLAFVVLGVLAVSREYGSGTIRTTMSVVPRRLPVLAAKVLVVLAAGAAVALPTTLVSFLLGQRLLDVAAPASVPGGLGVGLLDHTASGHRIVPPLQAVVGAALYLVGAALAGVVVAFLLRSTAGALSATIGVFFLLPPVVALLPHAVADDVRRWLPSRAGAQLWVELPKGLAPATGFAVYAGYLAALAALAAWRLRARDV